MRTTLSLATVALLLLSGLGHTSLLEDTTGLPYQDDAGSGRDADDACTPGMAPSVVLPVGREVDGGLLWPDDVVDVFALPIPATVGPGQGPGPGPGSFNDTAPKSALVTMDPRIRPFSLGPFARSGPDAPPGTHGDVGVPKLPSVPELPGPPEPVTFGVWNYDLVVRAEDCRVLGESRQQGDATEQVEVAIPDGTAYLVVEVRVGETLGTPLPVAGQPLPALVLQPPAPQAASHGEAWGPPTTHGGPDPPPPCYPNCFRLSTNLH